MVDLRASHELNSGDARLTEIFTIKNCQIRVGSIQDGYSPIIKLRLTVIRHCSAPISQCLAERLALNQRAIDDCSENMCARIRDRELRSNYCRDTSTQQCGCDRAPSRILIRPGSTAFARIKKHEESSPFCQELTEIIGIEPE